MRTVSLNYASDSKQPIKATVPGNLLRHLTPNLPKSVFQITKIFDVLYSAKFLLHVWPNSVVHDISGELGGPRSGELGGTM